MRIQTAQRQHQNQTQKRHQNLRLHTDFEPTQEGQLK